MQELSALRKSRHTLKRRFKWEAITSDEEERLRKAIAVKEEKIAQIQSDATNSGKFRDQIQQAASKRLWKTITCDQCKKRVNRDVNGSLNILYKAEVILQGYKERLGDGYPLLPQCMKRTEKSDKEQHN